MACLLTLLIKACLLKFSYQGLSLNIAYQGLSFSLYLPRPSSCRKKIQSEKKKFFTPLTMLTRSCSVWKHAQETTTETSNKSFMLWSERKGRYYCLLRVTYLLKAVTIFVLHPVTKEGIHILPLPKPVRHRVLPLSISSILSFPQGHPITAYVFFVVFPSLLSFPLSFLQ